MGMHYRRFYATAGRHVYCMRILCSCSFSRRFTHRSHHSHLPRQGNPQNQNAIAEAGAIQPLVSMLASPAPTLQASAAGALANLARGHPDNQAAIARTGAVTPLCTLVREGSTEAKDRSASAIWSLATDNTANKDTIAKLGGIDPLLGLLVAGSTEKSQEYVAGALAALASKHPDNRALVAKRLVGLLGSASAKGAERAVRVLMTISTFASDSTANQVAIAKTGGIPPLIVWVTNPSLLPQAQAVSAELQTRPVRLFSTLVVWLFCRTHTFSFPPLVAASLHRH